MSWDPEIMLPDMPCEPETLYDENSMESLKSYLVNPPYSGPVSGFEHEYFNVEDYAKNGGNETELQHSSNSDDHSGLPSDAMGNWPQRLLHVPTMTSYEWTKGNIYGSHVAPKYNAMSYTWGRFDLDFAHDGCDKRTIRRTTAISIGGTPWAANIPRINPEHFRVDEFLTAIKRSCELYDSKNVEFVWLDIACIDQRNGPQKAAEIGRQAVIFRDAQNVFIWLTRLNGPSLIEILECLHDRATYAGRVLNKDDGHCGLWKRLLLTDIYVDFVSNNYDSLSQEITDSEVSGRSIPLLESIVRMLDSLFMDPWFTSLWTLQEAFLCPRAYLLPREATTPTATLADLCQWCAAIGKACDALSLQYSETDSTVENEDYKPWAPNEKYLWNIKGMLRDRGLVALASRSPMALYAAAAYRRTRNEIDRVYAIEQVFDLRLGSSAPGSTSRPVHLVMLETELGAKILEKYPVLSQMHVFNEPVEPGRGWKVSLSSRVPDAGLNKNLAEYQYISNCSLTTQRASHLQWGHFNGRVCPFDDIRRAWALATVPLPSSEGTHAWKSPQWIALDKFHRPKKQMNRWIPPAVRELGLNTYSIRDLAVSDLSQYVPTGDAQHDLASLIVQRMDEWYKDKELVILYLGHFCEMENSDSIDSPVLYRVGLILLESEYEGIPFHNYPGVTYWRRLGFCIWTCQDPIVGPDAPPDLIMANRLLTVSSKCRQWREENGLFG